MSSGRLLLQGRLVNQSCGYHQYAILSVAFMPLGEGEPCVVNTDSVFSPDLIQGAFDGFARARRELDFRAGVVIFEAKAHEVDSHPRDFEHCALALVVH